MDADATVDPIISSHPDPTQEASVNETSLPAQDGKQDTTGSDEGDNKFHKAIAAWRNIDLASLVPSLDTIASDLVSHQRDALVERKELAQKTKEFRKLEDSAKLVEIKALLKSYQSYIDLVSNQSKLVSSSFFQVYSSLSEAPDPYPLLEASVESLVVADITVPTLEAENRRLQGALTKLTSQFEETEKQLADEQKVRRDAIASEESRIKDIEASWSAVLAEKQDNWEAREKGFEERAEHQERLLKEIKANYEVSQRLERSDGSEGSDLQAGATAAELDIVSSDLERTNSRLAEVEVRNEQLRLELARSATAKGTNSRIISTEEDPAYLRLRTQNVSLIRKNDALRLEKDVSKREWEADMRVVKRQATGLKDDNDLLRTKLLKCNDYEDIKQELEVLKSIEIASELTEDHDESGNQSADPSLNGEIRSSTTEKPSQNLERLLMGRNKKLNNELTVLRVSHQDLASRLETLQDDLSHMNMELEKSRTVTATLENDLSKMDQEMSGSHPAMSIASSRQSRFQGSSARRGRASPTSSIISGFETPQSSSAMTDANRLGEPGGGGAGILPMVTAQRDRFRKRNSELEAEVSKTYQTVITLRSEIASLQKDNLSLYEKTRYVSTYGRSQTGASSSAYSLNPNPSTVQIQNGDAPLDRYRSQYESRISPFAAFRGRESVRAFKRMSLPERGLYQVTRLVLATRTSRNIFAMYCLGLHLLVFGMLYYSTTIEVEKHVAHLADSTLNTASGSVADGTWHQESFQDAG